MRPAARLIAALTLALLPLGPSRSFGTEPSPYSWESRLRADAIALLGEVHDNQVQQRLRFEILRRAIRAGWRPAIAMEQFDREHQMDIDRARAMRPLDAAHLIEQASGKHDKEGGGWNWDYYRPYVALALEYHLPLLAANLSRSDAEKIVHHGYGAVFDAATIRDLELDRAPSDLQSLQQKEIAQGHCGALPSDLLPGMARAQMARDAVMAAVLRAHATDGVVLLAGDGHVRRDLGVPRWLAASTVSRVLSVGFLERDVTDPPADAFDAVVVTQAAARPDPCAALHRNSRRS
jgi:uncharacterized iron-regulated protein